MNIIINGRFLTQNVTGVQRYARELVQALDLLLDSRPDLSVTILSPRLSGPAPRWRNIVHREVGYLYGHAWEQLELPFFAWGKILFCPGNIAPAISLLCSRRVIVTVHDLSYRYFPDAYSPPFRLWYGMLVPLALRRAAAVITVSDSERRAILGHYPSAARRLYSVQNGGVPLDIDIEAKAETTTEGTYILYVGSLSRRKNFAGMLETACRLARKRDFHFVFIGGTGGGLSATTGRQVLADVASHIAFVGQIDDTAALVRYYREAACFLFPSFYESSGLPAMEAMACGCPVVTSDIPAMRERCGEAAIYCDPHDIDSIAAAVERVMDDAALRVKLRAAGLERARSYSWERCARETLDIICAAG